MTLPICEADVISIVPGIGAKASKCYNKARYLMSWDYNPHGVKVCKNCARRLKNKTVRLTKLNGDGKPKLKIKLLGDV